MKTNVGHPDNSLGVRHIDFVMATLLLVAAAGFAPGFLARGLSAAAVAPHALARPAATFGARHADVRLDVEPVPGPCPSCGDAVTYWDGGTLFVCTACAHEWSIDAGVAEEEAVAIATKDCNGVVLSDGDSALLVKELGKGLKKGLKVSKIRLGDFGDGHDVQATIKELGTYDLKSQFLKKA